jgi:hypothetical protein
VKVGEGGDRDEIEDLPVRTLFEDVEDAGKKSIIPHVMGDRVPPYFAGP